MAESVLGEGLLVDSDSCPPAVSSQGRRARDLCEVSFIGR